MKYTTRELTERDKTILYNLVKEDAKVKRLVATKDFGDVKAGDLGGFIHAKAIIEDDNSWVYDNSILDSGGHISGDTTLRTDSYVKDSKIIRSTLVNTDLIYTQDEVKDSKLEHSRLTGVKSIHNSEVIGAKSRFFEVDSIGYSVGRGAEFEDSKILASLIFGESKIKRSTVEDSDIKTSILDTCTIQESTVANSKLSDVKTCQAVVEHATLSNREIERQDVIGQNDTLSLSDKDLQDLNEEMEMV